MTNEELVEKIQQGERDLLPELWEQVKRFIGKIAVKWANAAEKDNFYAAKDFTDDLVQTGYIALVEAAEAYTPDANASFINFLSFYLKKHFSLEVGAHSGISRATQAATYRARQKLQSGQALSFEDRKSLELLNVSSLNVPYGRSDDGEGDELSTIIPSPDDLIGDAEERIHQQQLHDALSKAMEQLTPKQRLVLECIYYQNMTRKEAASVLGVSLQRACDLADKALHRMRSPSVRKDLESFIDVHTPFYLHVGVNAFHNTNTSAVEKIVLMREDMRTAEMNKRITEEAMERIAMLREQMRTGKGGT